MQRFEKAVCGGERESRRREVPVRPALIPADGGGPAIAENVWGTIDGVFRRGTTDPSDSSHQSHKDTIDVVVLDMTLPEAPSRDVLIQPKEPSNVAHSRDLTSHLRLSIGSGPGIAK
jgi:hypothetical protein